MVRAWRHLQTALATGGTFDVVIRQTKKSRDQERHYHALIGDIAKQYRHKGMAWDSEDMKRLLVDAFKHETKGDPENYPGLRELWAEMGDVRLVPAIGRDGFVALGDQTRKFPKPLATAFITWLYAFGAENGVRWTDPRWAHYESLPQRGAA